MNLETFALSLLNYFISVTHYKCTPNLSSDRGLHRESTSFFLCKSDVGMRYMRLQRKEAVDLQSE